MKRVVFRAEVFQEDSQYVGRSPELNVSSHGDSAEQPGSSRQEAVELFLEQCDSMGTLEDVLRESGFANQGSVWRLRERTREEKAAILS